MESDLLLEIRLLRQFITQLHNEKIKLGKIKTKTWFVSSIFENISAIMRLTKILIHSYLEKLEITFFCFLKLKLSDLWANIRIRDLL